MAIAIFAVIILIGAVLIGFLLLEFSDRNSVKPEAKRKWTDPKQ